MRFFCALGWLLAGWGCLSTRVEPGPQRVAIVVSMAVGAPSGDDWKKINRVMQPAIEALGYRFTTNRAEADVVVMLEYMPAPFPGTRGELEIGRNLVNRERSSGAALAATQEDMRAGIEGAMARR